MTTKLDEFHWHEALDRAALLADMIEQQLSRHPVIEQDPELDRLVDEAIGKLVDVYAKVAEKDPHWQGEDANDAP